MYFERWRFVLELVYLICWDRDDWLVRGAAGVPKAERVRRKRERERGGVCRVSVCLSGAASLRSVRPWLPGSDSESGLGLGGSLLTHLGPQFRFYVFSQGHLFRS